VKDLLQTPTANPQQAERDGDAVVRVGEALPARMLAVDMQRIFQIKKSAYYQLLKRGRFDRFELLPRIGRQRAFSGKLVQAYLDAEGGRSSRFKVAS
jgi:hypothetical protein